MFLLLFDCGKQSEQVVVFQADLIIKLFFTYQKYTLKVLDEMHHLCIIFVTINQNYKLANIKMFASIRNLYNLGLI